MKKNNLLHIASLLLLMLVSAKSFSTSCPRDYDMDIMNEGAEVVFYGKIRSKSLSLKKYKYTFEIENLYKGDISNETVIWSSFESDCGMNLDFDVPYIIFVYRENNKLWTGVGSSWKVDSRHQKYTDRFNKFYKLDDRNKVQANEKANVHEALHKAD